MVIIVRFHKNTTQYIVKLMDYRNNKRLLRIPTDIEIKKHNANNPNLKVS